MSILIHILGTSLPLLLASFGALISEYAGVMAIFIDGVINLSSFFCFAFSIWTGNPFLGSILSLLVCTVSMGLCAFYVEKTKANPFIVGISINLGSTGIISLLSSIWFKTKGVVSIPILFEKSIITNEVFSTATVRFGTTWAIIPSFILITLISVLLYKSPWGTKLRVTGTNSEVLRERGINTSYYRIESWIIAGCLGGFAGIISTLKLSAFVPNISAGTGWIALAIVFLGRKTPIGTIIGTAIFALSQYFINNIGFSTENKLLSPTLILAIPYLIALFCFIVTPSVKANKK